MAIKSRSITIQALIIIGLFTVASMFYKYASAVYKDYQVESEIRELQERIVYIDKDNKELEKMIEYLDTDAYKEIIAKSELNLRRPGEIVIAIQEESRIETEDLERFTPDSEYQNIPIYEKWSRLFFDY